MKKLAAFIMLLIHMNYFMFLPLTEEIDTYDSNGQQTDEINSVVEYVRVALGLDTIADDEDDDTGYNFTLVKNSDYCFEQQFTILENPVCKEINGRTYREHKETIPFSASYDIISPPPKV